MEKFFGKVFDIINLGGAVKSEEMSDETFMNEIKNTNLLAPLSKKTYAKNLRRV